MSNDLYNAAGTGRLDEVKRLIQAGADVNEVVYIAIGEESVNTKKETPLMTAVMHGHLSVIKALCDAGAKIDFQDRSGMSILAVALLYIEDAKKRQNVLEYFLSKKPDVNIHARDADTPLIAAARMGYLKEVEMLVSAGANLNAKGAALVSPLTAAVLSDKSDLVEFLLTKKEALDVNVRDANRDTPLIIAARNGNLAIVTALVEAGAKLKESNNQFLNNKFQTAVDVAASNGHKQVQVYLELALVSAADKKVRQRASSESPSISGSTSSKEDSTPPNVSPSDSPRRKY